MKITAYNSFVFSGMLHFSVMAIFIAMTNPFWGAKIAEKRSVDISFLFPITETETHQQGQQRNVIASPMPDAKSEKAVQANKPEKAVASDNPALKKEDVSAAPEVEPFHAMPLLSGETKDSAKTASPAAPIAHIANESLNSMAASTGAGGSFINTWLESGKGGKSKPVSHGYSDGALSVDKVVSGSGSEGIDLSFLADKFINHLEPFKRYPYIARRRGIEGTVLVKVELKKEGDISGVSVIRSSGYEILDENALSLIKTAGRFKHNTGRDIVIKVPVTYSLTKNAR